MAINKFYPIATTAKMTRFLSWSDDVPEFSMTSHKDCGFATISVVNDDDEFEPIENFFKADGLIKWSNKVYDMVINKEVPKPTGLLGDFDLGQFGAMAKTIGNFIDDMTDLGYRQMMKAYYLAGAARYVKNPQRVLNTKTYQSFLKLVFSPSLESAGNFLQTRNLMISAMHFQDAYNFDLERVKRCLVHYGVIDPDDPNNVLEIPFCAMNTVHRPSIEEKLARKDMEAEKPEEITNRITNYVEKMDK